MKRQYLAQAKQRFEELNFVRPELISGCSDETISELESALGLSLPAALREYLSWLGQLKLEWLYFYHYIKHHNSVRKTALSILKSCKNPAAQLPDDAIFLLEHHGYQFLYLRASEGHDPPVYFGSDCDDGNDDMEEGGIKQRYAKFSEYVISLMEYYAKNAEHISKFDDLMMPDDKVKKVTLSKRALEWSEDASIRKAFREGRLPERLFDFKNLTHLYASFVKLQKISPRLGNLTQLTDLRLNQNQLTDLPQEIGQLIALENLNIGSNHLSTLNPELANLTKLKRLSFDNNQIRQLPTNVIGSLVNLESLYLPNNLISEMPPEIQNLKNLREITLSQNPLSSEAINNLQHWLPNTKIKF
ncbi:MAG: SMI1/KNR4 family protein [Chloroflexota bacterium]